MYNFSWWLHAIEDPSSILCVVSGHICIIFIKTLFLGVVHSDLSNKTLPYHYTMIVKCDMSYLFLCNDNCDTRTCIKHLCIYLLVV